MHVHILLYTSSCVPSSTWSWKRETIPFLMLTARVESSPAANTLPTRPSSHWKNIGRRGRPFNCFDMVGRRTLCSRGRDTWQWVKIHTCKWLYKQFPSTHFMCLPCLQYSKSTLRDPCHGRPPVLKDRLLLAGCTFQYNWACHQRPPVLREQFYGLWGGLSIQVLL